MLPIFQTIFSPPRHLILLLVAAWLGLLITEKRLAQTGALKNTLSNLIFYGLVAGVLGGRIFFAAAHLPAFLKSPLSLFSPNLGLFDPAGALLAAALFGLIYGYRQSLPFWSTMDSLTPFFSFFAVGLGLSHLASGAAYGQPADVPWAIDQWNALRHPSQVYETLFASVILAVIMLNKLQGPSGLEFLRFVSLTVGAHLFLQAFRGDSTFILGGLRQAQIVDFMLLAASILVIEMRIKTSNALPVDSPD